MLLGRPHPALRRLAAATPRLPLTALGAPAHDDVLLHGTPVRCRWTSAGLETSATAHGRESCTHASAGRPPRVASASSAGCSRAAASSCGQRREFHASAPARAPKRDPYEVLGLSKTASKDDIKKNYYKLVKKYHPDLNKDDAGAAAKFQDVQAAYEILSDDAKRSAYDSFGHAGAEAAGEDDGSGGGRSGPFRAGGAGFMHPEDLFAQMFEQMGGMGGMGGMGMGRRGPSGPRRGGDVEASVTIPFMDAVNGCTRNVTTVVQCSCEACKGTGSAGGKEAAPCSVCKGSGQQTMQNGMFTIVGTCGKCGGEGTVIKNPCRTCGGAGAVRKPRSVSINIPPGVDTGVNLRLANEGDAGEKGGPSGHLYVRVNVEPDPFFTREGPDVHVTVPLGIAQAALGCTLTVPTVRGEADVKVPAGSQPGDRIVMRGKGIKKLGGGAFSSAGNQVVHLKIEVPRNPSPRVKELLKQLLEEEEGTAAGAGSSGSGSGGGGVGSSSGSGSGSSSGGGGTGWKSILDATLKRVRKAMDASSSSSSGGGSAGAAGASSSGGAGSSSSSSGGSSKS